MSDFRVLLVDDNPVNLDVLRVTLKQISECQVFIANRGQRALELMQRTPPDLVLLDVMMPDMDGFEVCRRIRQDPALAKIPVIFVTACTDDVSTGFEVGGNDYITKPINASEVVARVNHQLERHQLYRELETLNHNLEQMVRERTAALAISNRQLREEVKERRFMQDRLQYLATHDFVTHLYNRNALDEHITKIVSKIQLSGEEWCLIQVDLDRFRLVNESCGCIAGDELLRQFADLVSTTLDGNEFFARLGGDKFVIICKAVSRGHQIVKSMQAQLKTFDFTWEDNHFTLNASIGMVRIDRNIVSFDQLMLMADEVVYHLKRQKIPFLTYDEVDAEKPLNRSRVNWAIRIMDALKQNNFRIYFQKIVPLDNYDRDPTAMQIEVLVRLWDHESNRINFPDEFIPAAERYNLIVEIDQWMIANVLRYFSDHRDLLTLVDKVSINLSAVSIREPGLAEFIRKHVSELGIPPAKISFELTETEAIINMASAQRFLSELKSFGVHFSLDDFGSGFSSFNYLRELPFDVLKIDGVFIRDIDKNASHLALVKSIVEVAKQLDKSIVAEFVENRDIAQILASLGVHWGQGYYFHKPEPIESLQVSSALIINSSRT